MSDKVSEAELIKEINKAKEEIEIGARYRHSKSGREVTVLHIGLIEDDQEPAVIYQHEDGAKIIWVRPVEDFIEEVEVDDEEVPRFVKIEE